MFKRDPSIRPLRGATIALFVEARLAALKKLILPSRAGLSTRLRAVRAAAASGCIILAFEAAKHALYPGTSIFASNAVTILFASLVAALVTFAVLQKEAEGALRQSEIQYRLLFDSNPVPMWVFERKTLKFLAVNEAASRQYGFSRQEFLAMTIADIRPEEDIPDLLAATANPVHGLQEPTTWRHRKKNSAIIDVEIVAHDVDFHGIEAELVAARDVTERKRAEETVERLASIVEFSDDAIIGKNMDGVITSWNRAAEKMYGYTAAEVVGRDLCFLFPVEKHPEMRALMERIASGQSIECLETQRLTKTGSLLDMSMSISPIRDATGRITGASTIARDITLHKRSEEQLKLQSAALEAAANAIVITDYEGNIVWVNRAFTTMTGYTAEEVLGKNARVLKSGLQAGTFYADLWSTISSGMVWKGEIVNRRKDGTTYTEEMTITPVTRDVRNPANRYFIAIKQDITGRKKAEEALSFKTALLEAQTETTIDGILVVDESDHIVLANKQFALHFEIPEELLSTGDDRIVLRHVADKIEGPADFVERVKYLNTHRDEKSRDEIRFKNGTIFDRYSAPLVDSKGCYRGRIWYFRDITDRKLAEERIQFLAYYDALTGLPNRVLLQDRLAKALANARRRNEKVALLFLNLDRFKDINDSLGHSVGDLLLQKVAERLRTLARDQDTVARVGGDEFLIVLTGLIDVSGAAIAAERIVNMMTAEFEVQGHSLSVRCSIGVSLFPEHGADCETLIKNGDAAMYSAKESGRNNVKFFAEDMNAEVVERLTLENRLRLALDKNELFLMYQPQMEIASGRITGLEALLRWQHPDLGLVPPDRFIRIAENSGLIVPIGEWVLRTACSQARKWQEDGLPAVTVAVNVSAVQFRQEGFCELVRSVLRDTGLAAQYLELELTESLLLANPDLVLSVVQELKAMGVTLAIDDFGTGYSSFSYLRQFQVNRLKIDRSFIRDVEVKPDDAAITTAIISMAKSLNLRVIAEGVENEAQLSFLRANQCDEIQGYYFSKPLAVDKVPEKLRGGAGRALSAKTGV